MDFDTGFSGELKHGVMPICCWCSSKLDPSVMDIQWFWFVSNKKIYHAHTECGQNNMDEYDAEDFADWLKHERREMGRDDFFTT